MRASKGLAPRPLLNPAIRPLWREGNALQLGADPRQAIVIHDMDFPTAKLIVGLDGSRTETEILSQATQQGLDKSAVCALLSQLREAGVVVDSGPLELSAIGSFQVAQRLHPDHASLSLLHGPAGATETLRRRRKATVVIQGGGRIGTPLGALFAAAGIGSVSIVDHTKARFGDAAPGGLQPTDERRPKQVACTEALQRAAPEVTTEIPPQTQPDLVVITDPAPTEVHIRDELHNSGAPHLVATIRGTVGVVGPLVVPGKSSCLKCCDLWRTDRDASWPLLAAQLSTPRGGSTHEPCDVALATMVTGLAGVQALAFLARQPSPIWNGTLEIALPDWKIRRRSWPPHVRCNCGANQPTADVGHVPVATDAPEWSDQGECLT